MNKVVKHHVPVGELPEHLREGFATGEIVEVEVRSLGARREEPEAAITLETWLREYEAEHGEAAPLPEHEVERRRAAFARIRNLAGPRTTSVDEAVRRIRDLRDEDEG